MSLDSVENAEESGVMVIGVWRESPSRPLVVRVTTSRGDADERSFVTSSTDEVESAVRRWLLEFGETPSC